MPSLSFRAKALAALALFALTSGLAAGQSSPSTSPAAEPAYLEGVEWLERPTAEDFEVARPSFFHHSYVGGRAVLDCAVLATGWLDCNIVDEVPAGQGIGAVALGVAPKFRVGPTTRDGTPAAGGRVRIPIHFRMD